MARAGRLTNEWRWADHATSATTSRTTPYWDPRRKEPATSSHQQRAPHDQQPTPQLQLRVRIVGRSYATIRNYTNGATIFRTSELPRHRSQTTVARRAVPSEGLRPHRMRSTRSAQEEERQRTKRILG
eukprot:453421-Pyramimonas_sp.AAC.1